MYVCMNMYVCMYIYIYIYTYQGPFFNALPQLRPEGASATEATRMSEHLGDAKHVICPLRQDLCVSLSLSLDYANFNRRCQQRQ